MKSLFLIIGAPGSGKTTDATIVAEKNAQTMAHYSIGELLRAEVTSGSELGKIIDKSISAGNLVPLEIVINTVIGAIKNSDKDTILIDGFPRSVEQMNAFHDILDIEEEVKLVSVIEVEVSEEVACERVLGRSRGADDNVQVFKNRMQVYTDPLKDIQDYYASKKLLQKINGERTIEEIVADIEEFIKSKI